MVKINMIYVYFTTMKKRVTELKFQFFLVRESVSSSLKFVIVVVYPLSLVKSKHSVGGISTTSTSAAKDCCED